MRTARLAIDIGGTFTDLALEYRGRRVTTKVLTVPAAPEQGVLAGTTAILGLADLMPDDIGAVVHGTTLATNALIERRGARTAFVTTQGFRDVLAMGNESRFDQYDLGITLPKPLTPRHLRLAVPERLDASGQVLLPLDEPAVAALAPILRAERVESIAIGFLHSYVDPVHERRARDILAGLLDLPISISSEISPEMREWERFSTTVANAYVQPLMARYLTRLETGLRDMGVAAPLLMMLSGGGLCTIETACRVPIRLVESGPAGGAIFAADLARRHGLDRVLSFDMGGTTAKICLIDDGRPQTSRSFEVARVGRFKRGSGLPLRIPVIEMVEIGAGGGSLAGIDALARITVGPESAGADPGPACYGRGGARPAVTDANLVLGRYDPARFAGGTMPLDTTFAEAALRTHVGKDAGLAALGVVEMVDETMANAARVHAIESGKQYDGRSLIAFGGGGPVHACRVAEKLGIRHILVPPGAGVGSAIGFLRAPAAYEVVRSRYMRLSSFDAVAVEALLADMAGEAATVVSQASDAPTTTRRTAFMRYVGQGHEIPVPLPTPVVEVAPVRAAYDSAYAAFYDRPVPGSDIEVMSWAVTVTTAPFMGPVEATAIVHAGEARAQRVRDTATGEIADWAVHARTGLAESSGPAIIVEDETSTLVGPGWSARVLHDGTIELSSAAADRAVKSNGLLVQPSPIAGEGLADIHKQIMWNRLIAVVEEQAQIMIRTAFSTTVRESGDLSAGVFDLSGRMLAQAVTGTPGHVNSMMESVGHFLAKFPAAGMSPGDHYITNDPWLGTGHLHDLTVVTPAFHHGRLVGLFANTAHVIDVGGLGMGPEGRSVFEEGMYVPIVKCFAAGQPNETFFDFIRAGSRLPVELEGDVYSLCACNDAGARRLAAMLDEFSLDGIDDLAAFIFDSSRRATLAAIAELPTGTHSAEIWSDGYETPIRLCASMTIGAETIEVDFAGTSGISGRGINVPSAYTRAYSCFGIKCVVAPHVPNNTASLEPFRMTIPAGCILNAPRPAAVSVRHVIGHLLPDLMMGCLYQVVPDRVIAEGAACLWNPPLRGARGEFEVITFNSGGTGARPDQDGLDATAFPSGVRTMPVEATENVAPIVIWRKELRPGSGGAGRMRGGLGQIMEIAAAENASFVCNAIFDRVGHPPRGRDGGHDGAAGTVALKSGATLKPKGFHVIPAGDRLILQLPGGGGFGDPALRDPVAHAQDVRDGLLGDDDAP